MGMRPVDFNEEDLLSFNSEEQGLDLVSVLRSGSTIEDDGLIVLGEQEKVEDPGCEVELTRNSLRGDFDILLSNGFNEVGMHPEEDDVIVLSGPVESEEDDDVIVLSGPVESEEDDDVIVLSGSVESEEDDLLVLTDPTSFAERAGRYDEAVHFNSELGSPVVESPFSGLNEEVLYDLGLQWYKNSGIESADVGGGSGVKMEAKIEYDEGDVLSLLHEDVDPNELMNYPFSKPVKENVGVKENVKVELKKEDMDEVMSKLDELDQVVREFHLGFRRAWGDRIDEAQKLNNSLRTVMPEVVKLAKSLTGVYMPLDGDFERAVSGYLTSKTCSEFLRHAEHPVSLLEDFDGIVEFLRKVQVLYKESFEAVMSEFEFNGVSRSDFIGSVYPGKIGNMIAEKFGKIDDLFEERVEFAEDLVCLFNHEAGLERSTFVKMDEELAQQLAYYDSLED